MRQILRLAVCFGALALFVWTLLLLAAAVSCYIDIPELYSFYGPEALEEKLARGQLWVAVQGLASLLAAGVCAAAIRNAWKKRNHSREKREYHDNETSDSQRY